MIVAIEKPGSPQELVESLKHHGIKGQKWGVRKDYATVASPSTPRVPHRSTHKIKGLDNFPPAQAASMKLVAGKMSKAYGFKIDEFIPLTEKETKRGYLAYVEARGKSGNVIHMSNDPKLKKQLLDLEKNGWFPPVGGRVIESNITHESAHALFHVVDLRGKSWNEARKVRPLMDGIREKAWDKAIEQAIKDGDIKRKKGFKGLLTPHHHNQIAAHISGYAGTSMFLEEPEAEIFSAYHWSPNPPKYVDTFMNEVHGSMRKKVQPFSGRKVSYA